MSMNIEVQQASRGMLSTTHAVEDSYALPKELLPFPLLRFCQRSLC